VEGGLSSDFTSPKTGRGEFFFPISDGGGEKEGKGGGTSSHPGRNAFKKGEKEERRGFREALFPFKGAACHPLKKGKEKEKRK